MYRNDGVEWRWHSMTAEALSHQCTSYQVPTNWGTFSSIHLFICDLIWLIIWHVLMCSGRVLHCVEHRKQKMFLAKVTSVLGTIILPAMLSLAMMLLRYWGSLFCLILIVLRAEKEKTNGFTVIHRTWLKRACLLALSWECLTSLAALFCITWSGSISQPPHTGRQ